jgi:Bacterial Ig-like domain (group 3)
VLALVGLCDPRLERELRRQVGGVVSPGPGGLLGLELEFSVRSGQGSRVHFGSLIHRLALDGGALDPGDPNAYRCSWGGVITSDGAEAEIATPPVPTRPGFASQILSWAETGEAELRRAIPAGLELTGYSAHFSAAMPARLNEPVCLLYAQTFAVGLMLLMERADSPGLLIRPRPGRTELCGEFVAGEPLPAVAAFVAGSTRACAAAVRRRSAGRLLPPGLEVRLAPAVRRYGWYVDRAAFGTDLHAVSRRTLLQRTSGGTISAQSHLELAWAAARQVLAEDASDTDVRAADAMVAGSLPLPGEDRTLVDLDRREPGDGVGPGSRNRAARGTPLLLDLRVRPGFTLRPVAATWDFTVFEATGPARSAYACIPRDNLPAFTAAVEDGALDDAIAAYLARPAHRHVLSAHRQTGHLGVYDRMGAPAELLAPERDPQTGRQEPARRPAKYAFTRPGKHHRRDDPPDRPRTAHDDSSDQARPRFTRPALLAAAVLAVLVVGVAAVAVALGRPNGPPPAQAPLSFQPSALSFPDVTVNSSTTKDLMMTDTSRSPLTVSQIRISGPDRNDFSILAYAQGSSVGHGGQAIRAAASHPPTCPHPLRPAATCTIVIRFAPSQAGKRTSDLLIYLTSRPQPLTVAVTGTGTSPTTSTSPSPSSTISITSTSPTTSISTNPSPSLSPSPSPSSTTTITNTTVTSSLNPSVSGYRVSYTATVSPASATGTITFYDGGTKIGTAALDSSGTATITSSALAAGTHKITASYGGDQNFRPSTGSLTQTVKTATTTVLSSSPNPSHNTESVLFTATVSQASGTGTPTGTVTFTFYDGAKQIATPVQVTLSSGTATTTITFSGGTYEITASYGGDQNFAHSSDSLTQYVGY